MMLFVYFHAFGNEKWKEPGRGGVGFTQSCFEPTDPKEGDGERYLVALVKEPMKNDSYPGAEKPKKAGMTSAYSNLNAKRFEYKKISKTASIQKPPIYVSWDTSIHLVWSRATYYASRDGLRILNVETTSADLRVMWYKFPEGYPVTCQREVMRNLPDITSPNVRVTNAPKRIEYKKGNIDMKPELEKHMENYHYDEPVHDWDFKGALRILFNKVDDDCNSDDDSDDDASGTTPPFEVDFSDIFEQGTVGIYQLNDTEWAPLAFFAQKDFAFKPMKGGDINTDDTTYDEMFQSVGL